METLATPAIRLVLILPAEVLVLGVQMVLFVIVLIRVMVLVPGILARNVREAVVLLTMAVVPVQLDRNVQEEAV